MLTATSPPYSCREVPPDTDPHPMPIGAVVRDTPLDMLGGSCNTRLPRTTVAGGPLDRRRTSWKSLVALAPEAGRTSARMLSSTDYEGQLQLHDNSHNSSSSDNRRSSERCRSSDTMGHPHQQRAPMR